MSSYSSLARFYDALTCDVPYSAIADYYEALFIRHNVVVKTILDMACGTGTLTCLLAERGFDMIGVDASSEMLSIAAEKSDGITNKPMLINQTLEQLDLYGTVDAVVCSLDGMNYIKPDMIAEVFRRVLLFLEPGGLFIFDIHTPSMLKSIDGGVFLDETDDVYCVWRTEFIENENACHYGMDIFARAGNKWTRSREEHVEYAYEPHSLEKQLLTAGFEDISLYADKTLEKPDANDRRIFIAARKPK